jgi:hypothetical protein
MHADDWNGFGQRTTGWATSTFTDAVIDALIPIDGRFKYQTASYQAALLTVLAGSGLAAEREITLQVRTRNRVFSQGDADTFAADPQILQVSGEVSAAGFADAAIVDRAAEARQARARGSERRRRRRRALQRLSRTRHCVAAGGTEFIGDRGHLAETGTPSRCAATRRTDRVSSRPRGAP